MCILTICSIGILKRKKKNSLPHDEILSPNSPAQEQPASSPNSFALRAHRSVPWPRRPGHLCTLLSLGVGTKLGSPLLLLLPSC